MHNPVFSFLGASLILAACAGSSTAPVPSSIPGLAVSAAPATATLLPGEPTPVAATPFESFGDDITRELPPGDPERGEALFGPQGEFCAGCHSQLLVGPPLTAYDEHPALSERAAATIVDPSYSGQATSVTQYLVESIVHPGAYVVAGFPDGNMPNNLGLLLSPQDISDLVAYMLSVE